MADHTCTAELRDILAMIGTNSVPSEKQNSQIRDLIKHYREVLTEKSLASLDIAVLLDLKAQINDLETLISPARALIPELVATIFEFCVSSQGKLPTPSQHRAPLVLGQICASWRRIALSTPKLWRSILLRHDFNSTTRSSCLGIIMKQASTLEKWLARSGSVPIFCHIKYSLKECRGYGLMRESELSELFGAIRYLVSKLVPYVPRWKNIHLQLPFCCLTPLFDIHQVDAPMLKSLAVTNVYVGGHIPWPGYASSQQTPSAKFPRGARLRNVQIDIPRQFLPTLHLPWAQLEEITMTQSLETKFQSPNANLMLSDALDLLRRLPELKRCTLGIGSSFGIVSSFITPPRPPVVVPKLQKLFIYAEPHQQGLFLQAVLLPKLERLTIYKHWNRQALQSFLVRANHPIKELEFVRIRDISDDDLFNCLQLVPSLTKLQCTFPVGALVLRALTPSTPVDNSQSCLCPRLNFVEFTCHRPFDALVEMIEGRSRKNIPTGVSQLKRARLHLRFKNDNSERIAEIEAETEVRQRLQKCTDAGLLAQISAAYGNHDGPV